MKAGPLSLRQPLRRVRARLAVPRLGDRQALGSVVLGLQPAPHGAHLNARFDALFAPSDPTTDTGGEGQ